MNHLRRGTVEHLPGSVDADLVQLAVNEATESGRRCLYNIDVDQIPEVRRLSPVGQILGLSYDMVSGQDLSSVIMFARRLGTSCGRNSVPMHKDKSNDLRVLIEGDRSAWRFKQDFMLLQYPDGIDLTRGSAIVIDNRTMNKSKRSAHAVSVDDSVFERWSFLSKFSN